MFARLLMRRKIPGTEMLRFSHQVLLAALESRKGAH